MLSFLVFFVEICLAKPSHAALLPTLRAREEGHRFARSETWRLNQFILNVTRIGQNHVKIKHLETLMLDLWPLTIHSSRRGPESDQYPVGPCVKLHSASPSVLSATLRASLPP